MNILFVDHVCHQRTKSADFFLDVLLSRHAVESFYYSRHYHCDIPQEKVDWADVVVFWEFLPFRFACGIPGKRCVFVPMYDNEWGSKWLWRRLAMLDMNVISFCRAVGDHARKCGVKNVLDVCYAYDPSKFVGMAGDLRKVILWERGQVSFSAVKAMFRPQDVDKVTLVRREDEGVSYEPISDEDKADYHVDIKRGGFMPKDEYLAMVAESGVFVAPRFKEGIGMSFLEPLAMGKCVIAHDAPTMNEYIESGKNGLLVDMRHPRRVTEDEIVAARTGAACTAGDLYVQWKTCMAKILDFFDGLADGRPIQSPWSVRSVVCYFLYWLEGAKMRLIG